MSTRWEYVPATATVAVHDEGELPVENPRPGRLVLVVAYDERIVFEGTRVELFGLGDRILDAVAEGIPAPTVRFGDGGPCSSCCAAPLNITGVDRTLMKYQAVGLGGSGSLRISSTGAKFLEFLDVADLEIWCGKCEAELSVPELEWVED
jgi:hypothetical protein